MSIHNGGPAFPRQHAVADANDPSFKLGWEGMSLRDWFAGQALLGLCANARYVDEVRGATKDDARKGHALNARNAYRIADAMLVEREK